MSRLHATATLPTEPYPESLRQQRTPGMLLDAAARADGSRLALQDERRSLTYAELLAEVGRFQAALVSRGVGRGDIVSLMMPNRW